MMRLFYQSRKQQAQPEEGLPWCQGWRPRGGRENSHWWGRGTVLAEGHLLLQACHKRHKRC